MGSPRTLKWVEAGQARGEYVPFGAYSLPAAAAVGGSRRTRKLCPRRPLPMDFSSFPLMTTASTAIGVDVIGVLLSRRFAGRSGLRVGRLLFDVRQIVA